ncbi:uncharacterized protein KY384_003305 [Bacidia gigantensis]|uniref:uncharacterized protein n=1 Tax=Bacidia gigantensis TaxID=2732470 RepID=UPI001D053ED5|nr:uncharacterized protein KY384_003305 [Bacidia gigantensis]KAG8531673.1 hypothetical protein KY384_003305 [Bacidia gigantensis]
MRYSKCHILAMTSNLNAPCTGSPVLIGSMFTLPAIRGIQCHFLSSNNSNRFLKQASYSTSGPHPDKELFRDVLHSSTTKREAKSFLKRFQPKAQAERSKVSNPRNSGVNLGLLFGSGEKGRDAGRKDLFAVGRGHEVFHTALLKIRAPELISSDALSGIGRTLSQLAKLGMSSILVVDASNSRASDAASHARATHNQAVRIVDAIQESNDLRAQIIDQAFDVLPCAVDASKSSLGSNLTDVRAKVRLSSPSLLCSAFFKGILPVVTPVGLVHSAGLQRVSVAADDAMLAIVTEIVNSPRRQVPTSSKLSEAENLSTSRIEISLDRIIVLDPLGGIPSTDRYHGSHVYINLEQEFELIEAELDHHTMVYQGSAAVDVHSANLALLRKSLRLLPESSSGLITSPQEVLRSQALPSQQSVSPEVQTRRKRNPLIHNFLTDKPAVSSSLPHGRSSRPSQASSSSTFVKRGVPVTMIPNVKTAAWALPLPGSDGLSLFDPRIDLGSLVKLIEASFRRKLNLDHFNTRIGHRLAGVVVVGQYEGCALFTWESPPGFPNMTVPYLDKFAVLPEHQGTSTCISDVLFQAMVRDCFPKGVCWRSRTSNPVNKWYFERAHGTFKIPGTTWTSFWTTENPTEIELGAYESVCRTVEPSWAD